MPKKCANLGAEPSIVTNKHRFTKDFIKIVKISYDPTTTDGGAITVPLMKRPEPRNEEITLDPMRYIVSKTDANGLIEYGNDYFVEISGYKEHELIGKPHNIIRHPDMPKIIFKLMWDRIRQNKNIFALVKNMAKDGRYYWVVTEFTTKIHPLSNKPIRHTAYRKAAPKKAVKEIEKLYATLKSIEDENGLEAAEKYLAGFLEERGQSYDEFIDELLGNRKIFKTFFSAMKKLFG
jgi:PAS domain S-box-containing protein